MCLFSVFSVKLLQRLSGKGICLEFGRSGLLSDQVVPVTYMVPGWLFHKSPGVAGFSKPGLPGVGVV